MKETVEVFKDGVLVATEEREFPDPPPKQETEKDITREILQELLKESKSTRRDELKQKLERLK